MTTPAAILTDTVLQAQGQTLTEKVLAMTTAMLELPQAKCEVLHRFGPGLYIREVQIPAGTLAVGHVQRFEHLNVMLKGRVTVLNDDGTTTDLEAPMMFVGQPGRKVGIVHEDMVWQNIYATTETDIEKLEATYLEKGDVWNAHLEQVRKALLPDLRAQTDYYRLLEELGVTEAQVREEVEADNVIPLGAGCWKVKLGHSMIEGRGVFATADIAAGEWIGPARIGDKRTILGRYANHSPTPNAIPVLTDDGGIDLVAAVPIAGCAGGMDGDEITINYRHTLELAKRLQELAT